MSRTRPVPGDDVPRSFVTLHALTLHALTRPAAVRRLAGRALVVALSAGVAVTLPAPSPGEAAQETVRSSAAEPVVGSYRPRLDDRASRSGVRSPLAPQVASSAPTPSDVPAPTPSAAPQVLVTERLPLPFRTVRRADATRAQGTEAVAAAGRAGVLERTYTDLGPAGRTLLREERVREPQDRVVAVGARARPTYGGLDWAALARCESGGDPRAVSRTGRFRGLYQFSRSTWRSVGGTGDPAAHNRDTQTAQAWKLYQRDGRAPWPECGRHL